MARSTISQRFDELTNRVELLAAGQQLALEWTPALRPPNFRHTPQWSKVVQLPPIRSGAGYVAALRAVRSFVVPSTGSDAELEAWTWAIRRAQEDGVRLARRDWESLGRWLSGDDLESLRVACFEKAAGRVCVCPACKGAWGDLFEAA